MVAKGQPGKDTLLNMFQGAIPPQTAILRRFEDHCTKTVLPALVIALYGINRQPFTASIGDE